VVVAHALLRPASGRRIVAGAPITAENLDLYRPKDADVQRVMAHLADAGFRVERPPGIALMIQGPVALFQRHFGVDLVEKAPGDRRVRKRARRSDPYEIPLTALPKEIAELLEAITLEPPAELT
jgi:hypothetical protein